MNLDDFEEYVDKKILNRGYDYYIEDNIYDCYKESDSTYIFAVHGSDDYEVVIESKDGYEIDSSYCDCPYDFGPVCKHEVAAYYYLRDNINDFDIDEKNTNREYIDKDKLFKETLESLSKEKLIEIINDQTIRNSSLKDEIILQYSVMTDEKEIKQCEKMIDSIKNKYSDRRGFIDYNEAYEMINELNCVVNKINNIFVERKNYVLAVNMAFMVIKKLLVLEQECFDHDGSIDNLILEIINLIEKICEDINDGKVENRIKIFDSIVEFYYENLEGNCDDYIVYILRCCISFCEIKECKDILESEIKLLIHNYNIESPYDKHKIEELKVMLFEIYKLYGDEVAKKKFLKENYYLYEIRKIIFQEKKSKRNYEEALEILKDSEMLDKENRYYINEWKEEKYKIYDTLNKYDEKEKLAREMLLNGDVKYYDELKKMHKDDFKEFYKGLIVELRKRKVFGYAHVYLSVILRENDRAEIMDYVRKNPMYIEQYVDRIKKDYKDETEIIYKKYILDSAKGASKRTSYSRICDSIKKYKRLYGKEKADEIIIFLRENYRRKPAFMEELNEIK